MAGKIALVLCTIGGFAAGLFVSGIGGRFTPTVRTSAPVQGVSPPQGQPAAQAVATTAPVAASASAGFEIVAWHTERDAFGFLYLIGELKNTGAAAAGVELQAIARNKAGEVIDTASWWPASTRNIPAGESWPIKHPVSRKPDVDQVAVRVVGTRVWPPQAA